MGSARVPSECNYFRCMVFPEEVMRRRVYFYEYECDKCLKKIKKAQTDEVFCVPQGWDRRKEDDDDRIYLYCEGCK